MGVPKYEINLNYAHGHAGAGFACRGSGGKEAEDQWEKHHIRKLDTLATVKAATKKQ